MEDKKIKNVSTISEGPSTYLFDKIKEEQCSKLLGSAKIRCLMKACDEVIKSLKDELSAAKTSRNPEKARKSIEHKLRTWVERKNRFAEQMRR